MIGRKNIIKNFNQWNHLQELERIEYYGQDEILDHVAEEFKIPREKVLFLVRQFFDTLRYYLTHPLETKGGIVLENTLTFKINERMLWYYIHKEFTKDDEDLRYDKMDNLIEIVDNLNLFKKPKSEIIKILNNDQE